MSKLRNDWTLKEIKSFFALPFNDLVFQAHTVYRDNFDVNEVQISTLLSIKTGACKEDCKYCSQSSRNDTGLESEALLPLEDVIASAKAAKAMGSSRFCMGAAWRNPNDRQLEQVIDMVIAVREENMETCVTLGMLSESQAKRLKEVGLDYYNHNLDTSPEFYGEVITTRTYQDRLDTLRHVRNAGIKTCSGGIIGMGENSGDRAGLLMQLANLPQHPESVPINNLVQIEGTPLYGIDKLDPLEFIRMIAVARILMPQSYVRLSAGRNDMSNEMQAMCFFVGANSIFYGKKLLTTDNSEVDKDQELFKRLGVRSYEPQAKNCEMAVA